MLFETLSSSFRSTGNRKLVRLPHHINDPAFADALVANFNEIAQSAWPASLARTS
jgi:uncharacterized protein (UPF0261 family)